MKANMTHNESVKTFDDIHHHLELEDEHYKAAKHNSVANVVASSSRKASRLKCKRAGGVPKDQGEPAPKKSKSTNRKRGKRGAKKDLSKAKCYNCQKMGHLARDYAEAKKVLIDQS